MCDFSSHANARNTGSFMTNIELRKLKAEDLKVLISAGGRTYITNITKDNEDFLNSAEHYYTIFIDDTIAMCGGVSTYWPGRGESWAVLNPQTKHRHLIKVNHLVKKFLEECPVTRIEASVDVDFLDGHRWVQFLGFELETPVCRKFLPDGKDASLYVRIKKESIN